MDDDAEEKKSNYIRETYFIVYNEFTPANVQQTLTYLLQDNKNLTYKDKMNIILEIQEKKPKYEKELTLKEIGELNKIFKTQIGELIKQPNGFKLGIYNNNQRQVVVTPTSSPYNKNGGKRTRKSVKRKIKKSKRKQSVKISKRITNKKRHKR
jgi:hypothetical protein